jgi:hypothetical protein
MQFRLRGGHQFRRQTRAVHQIVSGEAQQGQMEIYLKGKEVMCKMVAWLLRSSAENRAEGTLFVRSDAEALIVALNVKENRLWTYHGDQVRQWTAEHRKMLQHLADDTKAENRPDQPFANRREAAVRKYRDRMTSLTHQIAAMIVGYAQRRRFAAVQYNDSGQGFCPQFPWLALRTKISEKCDAASITFEHATSGKQDLPNG